MHRKPINENRITDMNVAVIGLRGIPEVQGGIEKHCESLYPYIAKYCGKVTIFGRKGYIAPRPFRYKGIRVIPIWCPRSKYLETMVHTGLCCIWLLLNSDRFNIVHIHAIGPSLFALSIRVMGLKVVVTNHGHEYDRQKWGRIAKWVLRISESIGIQTSHQIIAVSRAMRAELKRKYGVDAHYIPNGVTKAKFVPAGATLRRFNLEPQKYVLGVGRLVPEKGFHDLMAAFNKVATDWKLAVVGAADHEDRYSRTLKAMARRSDRVRLTGFLKGNALHELYSNAGIFVLPSYHEGLSIAALEAISYGLPVLLSDIPANREIALPDELFPSGDVVSLAHLIEMHIADPRAYFQRGQLMARRNRLASEFDWHRIARQTARVYATLTSSC